MTAICAACGAKGPHGRIRCLACGKPLMFASPELAALAGEAKQALRLVKAVRSHFAGKNADVQGAALADLLAMFLAGHVVPGDPEQTKRVREQVLEMHLKAVRALVDINYKMTVEPQIKQRMQ